MRTLCAMIVFMLLLPNLSSAHCLPTKRSSYQVRLFKKITGYPHGRKGYVVDHIVPLCAGGADKPSNMQWQTIAESKIKDIDEVQYCHMLWYR